MHHVCNVSIHRAKTLSAQIQNGNGTEYDIPVAIRAAGIAVRGRGGSPSAWPPKPAIEPEVSTDFSSGNSADLDSKPATTARVSTDLAANRSPTASAWEPYRELIVEALARGRNARAIWQDLTG